MKRVVVLAGHKAQWPIVHTLVPVKRSHCTRTLTHCGHKANKTESVYSVAIKHNDPLCTRTYQLNGVIALALWPIAVTKQVNRVGAGTRWPLRQTNVVVPNTVTFAVDLENWASIERPKATHYSTITASYI